jgi:hypothetical protein
VRLTTHLHLVPKLRMSGFIRLLPLYALVKWIEATAPLPFYLLILFFLSFFFLTSLNFFYIYYAIRLITSLLCPYFILDYFLRPLFHSLCIYSSSPLFQFFILPSFFMFFSLPHTSRRVTFVTCSSLNISFIGAVLCGFQVFSHRHVVVSRYIYYCLTLPTGVERR